MPNHMNANHIRSLRSRRHEMRRSSARRSGFTLVEILVALGVFAVLLTILLVPLNLGVNLTRIGSARTDAQQAAQSTMNRIVTDLRAATYVFPNEPMPGITNKAPYTNNKMAPGDALGYPYFRAAVGTEDVCGAAKPEPFANTSRIEFLKPTAAGNGTHSIVSFYTARADVARKWNDTGANPYDADLNSIVMYSAQIPFERVDGTDYLPSTTNKHNALVGSSRLPDPAQCTNSGADINQGTRWLMHNGAGEPELARISGLKADPNNPGLQDDINPSGSPPPAPTDPASNSRITPLGIGLYAPQANNDPNTDLKLNATTGRMFTPSTSFICEDTNANGIIDRVTVTLVMGKYDGAGAENRAQSVRLTQTVDLPNVESRFGNSR